MYRNDQEGDVIMYVSQLLSEYIKTKKINIKKCAEYFQIDRSTLYKIIRGERKVPSRDFIQQISQYLYLTNDEKKELLEAYEIDRIGEFRYYCRQHVSSFLEEAALLDNRTFAVNDALNPILKTGHYTNKYDVEHLLYELSLLESKEKDPHIRIFGQPTHALYLLRIVSSHIPITHLFCLNNTNELTKDNQFYNLTVLTNIMPLIFNNDHYSPYYYYNEINAINNHLCFFPNMILTHKYLLIYTTDHSSGILYERGDTYNAYEVLFNQYLKETKCLISNKDHRSDMIEDFNYILYAPSIGALYQEDDPFPVSLKDNDFIESFKRHSIHLKQYLKSNTDHLSGLYTLQGLRHFVDTGYTTDFPQQFYHPLTIIDRIKILRRLKNFMNSYSLQLVDIPEYSDTSFLIIVMNMNTLYFQIVSASGTVKTIQLHEASLVMAFNDYYLYIVEERCLSKEDAFKIIDTYITQLENRVDKK